MYLYTNRSTGLFVVDQDHKKDHNIHSPDSLDLTLSGADQGPVPLSVNACTKM